MKPSLVLGLGNPLLGDEGVGWHIVDRLAGDPRLPEDTEVAWGGTDLLRAASLIEGRQRVLIVDAALDGSEPGSICVLEEPFPEDAQAHAHHLSVTQALGLLRLASPAVPITVMAISIDSALIGRELSPGLAGRIPELLARVLRELAVQDQGNR